MISLQDKGKKFALDGKKDYLVTLHDIADDGWAKIIHPDGRHTNVTLNRLEDTPVKIEDDPLDYPEKAVKVVIQLKDENGSMYVKYLDGEDAVKWNNWMRELCWKAEEVGMNPPWLELNWKTSKEKAT